MGTYPQNEPQGQPLDREALQNQLNGIDETSLAELLAFKRGVESMMRSTAYFV